MPKDNGKIIYCRVAPSIGSLEDRPENIWGTPVYDPKKHINEPCVFFGLYGLPDFYALWRHKGKKYVLWAGSDIRHFIKGYWLDDGQDIHQRLSSWPLAEWLRINCEHWVENQIEQQELAYYNIKANVCPSFLGDVSRFEVSFKPGNKLYTSVSGDEWFLYGWDKIPELAKNYQSTQFHLYGNIKEPPFIFSDNVVVHGRVSKEQMNQEIKEMQGALRLTEFDGFSEILAKSILMGQHPVSIIQYEHMLNLNLINRIVDLKSPNLEGRKHYLKILNNYPWNHVENKPTTS